LLSIGWWPSSFLISIEETSILQETAEPSGKVSERTEIKPRKFQTSVDKQNARNEKANAWFLDVVEFYYENNISVNTTKNDRALEH